MGIQCPPSPYQGSQSTANTGHEYWRPGVGRRVATQEATKEGGWTQRLERCRTQDFCVETAERSSGQTLVVIVPPHPRTTATVSQQEGPKTGAGGASAWPSLPGCLSQCWLRETGTGDGDVPQGAAAMSSFDSSAAAGAPRGSWSIVPSRIEGTSTALWGGDVPSPTDTKTLMFELKNKR